VAPYASDVNRMFQTLDESFVAPTQIKAVYAARNVTGAKRHPLILQRPI